MMIRELHTTGPAIEWQPSTWTDGKERDNINWFKKEFDWRKSHSKSWWKQYIYGHELRTWFVRNFSFAIPTTEALEAVAAIGPTVEFLSGSGYWAYLLQKFGINLRATDINKGAYQTSGRSFVPINTVDVRKQRPVDCAFVQWIPMADVMDNYLNRMQAGQRIIVTGEGSGGCTACKTTFEILDEKFEVVGEVPMIQFYGIHDYTYIYERKS